MKTKLFKILCDRETSRWERMIFYGEACHSFGHFSLMGSD